MFLLYAMTGARQGRSFMAHRPSLSSIILFSVSRMSSMNCGAHRHLSCVHPFYKQKWALPDPPHRSPGWFCSLSICSSLGESFPALSVGAACSKLQIVKVKKEFGAAVKIVHVDMVPGAKMRWLDKIHDQVTGQAMVTGSFTFSCVDDEICSEATVWLCQNKQLQPHLVDLSFIYWVIPVLALVATIHSYC